MHYVNRLYTKTMKSIDFFIFIEIIVKLKLLLLPSSLCKILFCIQYLKSYFCNYIDTSSFQTVLLWLKAPF